MHGERFGIGTMTPILDQQVHTARARLVKNGT